VAPTTASFILLNVCFNLDSSFQKGTVVLISPQNYSFPVVPMKFIRQIFIFSILKTFTAIFFVTFFLSAPSLSVSGQIIDNFDDNDFTSNPIWGGTSADFQVVDGQLQLKAPASSSTSYLTTESSGLGKNVWEFYFRLAFNPSSSNYLRVFLASDGSDLSVNPSGYYLIIGGTADDISLYSQVGTTKTKLIDGMDGILNLAEVSGKVKVTRSFEGVWELAHDLTNSGGFTSEGSISDQAITTSTYFGLHCYYTSTRSDKFFFDDFKFSKEVPKDSIPPNVETVMVASQNELVVLFSEPVTSQSSTDPTHYLVDNGVGLPSSITLSPDLTSVNLTFHAPFVNGKPYKLTVQDVEDAASNKMALAELPFTFTSPEKAAKKDVIISEIFPDPSPALGLPEFEFLELYNRSDKSISIDGWTLTDGSTIGEFDAAIILPGEYVIITAKSSTSAFASFGRVIGVTKFPSLNNSGDGISLLDDEQNIIDVVNYASEWYRDPEKQQGGWSLEIIDTNNVCAEGENWGAAETEIGGTPGQRNSIEEEKPDLTGPVLTEAIALTADSLVLYFNEKLEYPLSATAQLNISPTTETSILAVSNDLKTIFLNVKLLPKQLYKIEVSGVYDCPGNVIALPFNQAEFALAEEADSADVVINEILFNPWPEGSDFIEVFNRSDKFINLKGWSIGNVNDAQIGNKKEISSTPKVLRPLTYLALTKSVVNIRDFYPKSVEGNMLEADLPAFNDDTGSAVLLDSEGKVIDLLTYDEHMHSPFLQSKEGVSLERLSGTTSTALASNWKSCASQNGFGTPGYRNSNSSDPALSGDEVQVSPEIFLPESGTEDFTTINYNLQETGVIASIRIFDSQGHRIKTVAENALLGTSGFFRWDGDKDDGTRARVGAYMVLIQFFNSTGDVKVLRRRVAIAGRFKS
jgi:hypothetical protein